MIELSLFKFEPDKPFNNLSILPPKANLETVPILKKVTSARAALAELKGIAGVIPNQNILINTISLKESKDSSEIENIITTNDKLFKAISSNLKNIDSSTKEVIFYREALWEGYRELKKSKVLTINAINSIQEKIINNNAGIRKLPGTKIQNIKTGKTVYTPPEGVQLLNKLLVNLETYINTNGDIDPLIKLAIIHYQFEAIHPYYDGNGRTGRIINILYLILKQLLDIPVLYLSSYVIKNKGKYYDLLRSVTENESWEKWILFVLDGIEQTSRETIEKINEIKDLFQETIELVKNKAPKIYKKELIELLFENPYTKIDFVVKRNIAGRETASKYLSVLTKLGVLKIHKFGNENLYLNVKLYNILK
ncbi:MAG: Fic family protein [Bacteroidota bacterium]|nr:Fic family protein [Bacteroidota bacterium]